MSICAASLLMDGVFSGAAAEAAATLGGQPHATAPTMIRLRVADQVITARVDDGPTSRGFLGLLPMTVIMQRYGDREYYGKPGHAFSVEGKHQSHFSNGDLAYWAPGGSLAVFFAREGQSSISDLIVMGKVTSDLSLLDQLGRSIEMTIETDPAPRAAL